MTFRPELIGELLKGYCNLEDLMGEDGIFKQLTKALIERCLSAELDTYLAEEKAELTAHEMTAARTRGDMQALEDLQLQQEEISREIAAIDKLLETLVIPTKAEVMMANFHEPQVIKHTCLSLIHADLELFFRSPALPPLSSSSSEGSAPLERGSGREWPSVLLRNVCLGSS